MGEVRHDTTAAAPPPRPRAIAAGELRFGEFVADAYVLDDGRRVLSQRGILRALGRGAEDGKLGRFLSRLPSRFQHLTMGPTLEFIPPQGGVALGREGTFFVELCDAYVDGFMAGELHPMQEPLAHAARVILRALERVGIEAYIDEATGYQHRRPDDYLGRRIDQFVRSQASEWEPRFPASLVRTLAPHYGITYTGGSYPRELFRAFGLIYDLVLGKDVAREMRSRNPNPEFGSNHHQYLQDDVQKLLTADLRIIELLARQSRSRAEFWSRMRSHFLDEPLQLDCCN